MIAVNNLSLTLDGISILQGIDFVLEDGHNLAIIGRSGSGKTMLIKTIMGFHYPTGGSVAVDGKDVHATAEQPSGIAGRFAMVFQNAALLDSFTVAQNVALPLYYSTGSNLRGEPAGEVVENVRRVLGIVGLNDCMEKYPSELSGGMRKRVGIARALVSDPAYLIFDEPLSGLDPITSGELMYYITQVIDAGQITAITITHDMRDLDRICDRVLFLEGGKQLFFGGLSELYSCLDPLVQRFIGL